MMRYLEPRKARIEIVPMIDIMFFLLVFFVIAMLRMIPSSGIASQLPHSSTATDVPHPKVLVELTKNGSALVDDKPITLPELSRRLAHNDPAKTAVTIASDQGTSVQSLMAVMDACRTAGVTQIALAAKVQR
ncbi:ExbD/TolR family protein [Paraburkholderia humisilvae]|uniref:Tol-Pal system protein TolR n=1 Tax=Paraburkholderia humisilvae TaxID=627669 RepID=A0A6J5EAF1_9BURK|nr:biopolymer transporter ExbD [Paraburkholderia humisilvae]CAB3762132.1 Tol-Pal system protein TolR [Paraburkholderia humisilvae]